MVQRPLPEHGRRHCLLCDLLPCARPADGDCDRRTGLRQRGRAGRRADPVWWLDRHVRRASRGQDSRQCQQHRLGRDRDFDRAGHLPGDLDRCLCRASIGPQRHLEDEGPDGDRFPALSLVEAPDFRDDRGHRLPADDLADLRRARLGGQSVLLPQGGGAGAERGQSAGQCRDVDLALRLHLQGPAQSAHPLASRAARCFADIGAVRARQVRDRLLSAAATSRRAMVPPLRSSP